MEGGGRRVFSNYDLQQVTSSSTTIQENMNFLVPFEETNVLTFFSSSSSSSLSSPSFPIHNSSSTTTTHAPLGFSNNLQVFDLSFFIYIYKKILFNFIWSIYWSWFGRSNMIFCRVEDPWDQRWLMMIRRILEVELTMMLILILGNLHRWIKRWIHFFFLFMLIYSLFFFFNNWLIN